MNDHFLTNVITLPPLSSFTSPPHIPVAGFVKLSMSAVNVLINIRISCPVACAHCVVLELVELMHW